MFADIARKLKQHVFQQPASVSPQLLMAATLCCQRIGCLLLGWEIELREHGTVSGAAAPRHLLDVVAPSLQLLGILRFVVSEHVLHSLIKACSSDEVTKQHVHPRLSSIRVQHSMAHAASTSAAVVLQLGAIDQCRMLVAWTTDSGLLCELAEGVLLVLRMDPAPFQARGFEGIEEFTNTVLMAITGASNVQWFVLAT
jgi:hypothetical protein